MNSASLLLDADYIPDNYSDTHVTWGRPGSNQSAAASEEAWQAQSLSALSGMKARLLLPAILVTLVLMLVGLVGNPLALYIYGWRWQTSSTKVFLFTLAVIDLVNCLATIPMEITMMTNYYQFPSDGWCKMSRFVTYVMNNATSAIFLVIAVDRYLRICHPHRRAVSARGARLACGVGMAVGLLVGWPALFLYGRVEVPIPVLGPATRGGPRTMTGHMCLVSPELRTYSLAFFLYLCSAFSVCVLVLILLYTLIGRDILRRKRQSRMRKETTAATLENFGGASPRTKNADGSGSPALSGSSASLTSSSRHRTGQSEAEASRSTGGDAARPQLDLPGTDIAIEESHAGTTATKENPLAPEEVTGGSGPQLRFPALALHRSESDRTELRRSASGSALARVGAGSFRSALTRSGSGSVRSPTRRARDEESPLAVTFLLSGAGGTSPKRDEEDQAGPGCNVQNLAFHCKKLRPPKATLMLFLITIVYVASFLPFLIITIIRQIQGASFYLQLSPREQVAVNIFIRSYLVNNCANPIVYGLCNSQFREECRRLYYRLFRKSAQLSKSASITLKNDSVLNRSRTETPRLDRKDNPANNQTV